MPVSFDPSQIWNPFVSDDESSEDEQDEGTESEDNNDDSGTRPITYALDPGNVPRVEVTTESSDGSNTNTANPSGSFSEWHDTIVEQDHTYSSNTFTAQAEHGGQVELSTNTYDDLLEAIREHHSGRFEGYLEQLHQDTSPRQDTLSDAI